MPVAPPVAALGLAGDCSGTGEIDIARTGDFDQIALLGEASWDQPQIARQAYRLGAPADAELGIQVRQMRLDGVWRKAHGAGDLLVRTSDRQLLQDPDFLAGQTQRGQGGGVARELRRPGAHAQSPSDPDAAKGEGGADQADIDL